jgi:hypothetical protein
MIKLKSIINENSIEDSIVSMADPFFKEFSKKLNYNTSFKYLGLKNGEHIFTSTLKSLGDLRMIFSEAVIMARINKDRAYFGIIYTLNGLEQFDATVCLIKNTKSGLETKLFDDSDSDFSDAKTDFIKLIKIMV